MACVARRSVAMSILRGRPPRRPLALAAARPARVRSAISPRSNSASAPKMLKTRRPFAVVVSISAPAPASTHRPTPRPCNYLDRRHQMFQVASQAVELPDDERVARLQGLEAGIQAGPVVLASGGAVFVDALLARRRRPAGRHAAGQGVEYRPPWRRARSRSTWCVRSLQKS